MSALSEVNFERLRGLRRDDPKAVIRAAAERRKRGFFAADGRMMLIAADHPARGAIAVGDDRTAMSDRLELLERLVTALRRPGVDGVLGTADILEDLLLLGELDDKVVVGSMNRGGLAGAVFELDDRFTSYDAQTIDRMRFDGGKMLLRIDLADAGTASTLERCSAAIGELSDRALPAMIEPFMASRDNGKLKTDLSAEGVMRSIAIANGLGRTSQHTVLKLPAINEMAPVLRGTTLPVVLLGGDPSGHEQELHNRWRQALECDGVCGLVVGRALLYPRDGDIAGAVDHAVELVHGRQIDRRPAPDR